MCPAGTHLYKKVCPSIYWSVGLSVGLSIRYASLKITVFDASWLLRCWVSDRTLFNIKPCLFICLFVRPSLHICHMINSPRNTIWTHCCPVGLVLMGSEENYKKIFRVYEFYQIFSKNPKDLRNSGTIFALGSALGILEIRIWYCHILL